MTVHLELMSVCSVQTEKEEREAAEADCKKVLQELQVTHRLGYSGA